MRPYVVNMTSIIITGCAGRMGKTLVNRAMALKKFDLMGATEAPKSPFLGQDIGVVCGLPPLQKKIASSIKEVVVSNKKVKTVIIDFTTPKAGLDHLIHACEYHLPLVIGTTGFNEAQQQKIKKASTQIPIVLSPNMSVGVNTLFELVAQACQILGEDFDIEILEAHHSLKKDAPSGTAVKLAQILAEISNRKYPDDFSFGRKGIIGQRPKKEIGMQVIRGGDIVGEHTVFFCGQGERLEIKHTATSRNTFADGALRAAAWLATKKVGLYSMRDVLNIS